MAEAEEQPCEEIIWRIANFTYCWQEKGERLTSSNFVVECLDKTSWHLRLFSKGNNCTDDLGIYLHRADNDKRKEIVLVNFEITVLEDGNLPYATTVSKNKSFVWNGVWGFGLTVSRSDIIKDAGKLYPNNVLTVRCKMWPANSKRPSPVFILLRTLIPVTQCSFEWKIDLTEVDISNKEKIIYFHSLFGSKDYLQAKISYVCQDINGRVLKMYISGTALKKYSFKCDIQTDQAEDFFLTLRKIDSLPYESYCSTLITQNQLLKNSKKYLAGKFLCLNCEFTIISHEVENYNPQSIHYIESEKSSKWYPRVKGRYDSLYPEKRGCIRGNKQEKHCCLLKSDVLKMYQDALNSDFSLQVESQTFPVHANVLSARSAVLNRMLDTKMKEKQEKILKIEDLDGSTVKKMLDYVYTDSAGELNIESAVKLYYAGDKYELFGLKQICSEYMMQNMTICNVYEVLMLAYQHNDENLKSSAIHFMFINEKDTVLSDQFNIFCKNHPQLGVEVMQNVLKRKF